MDRVTVLMPQLCRAMMKHESNHMTRGELNLPQFLALEYLRAEASPPMHQLLDALQLKSSTGTVFVDRLVRLGLVKRLRDAMDRRAVRVALTAKGRRILEEIHSQKRRSLLKLYRPLTAAERTSYLSVVEKMVREFTGGTEAS